MRNMKVTIGSDHAGFEVKERVKAHLAAAGHEVIDQGPEGEASCDYPDFAAAVAQGVAAGEAPRGILVCGTGIGMAMAAGKIRGIRAAVCHSEETSRLSREHNDANVLCVGARVLKLPLLLRIVDIFLATDFEGGRHQRRVDKIHTLEA